MFVDRKMVNKSLAEFNHDLFSDSTRDVHARLSEKTFVLFIQYPPNEGLFPLDWHQFLATQKRVAAL